jgi:hypothetical protein
LAEPVLWPAQRDVRRARGRGTRVTSAREAHAPSRPAALDRLSASLRIALADARLSGLDHEDALKGIDDLAPEFWPSAGWRDHAGVFTT